MKVYERFGDTQRGLLMELGSMLIVTLFVISGDGGWGDGGMGDGGW